MTENAWVLEKKLCRCCYDEGSFISLTEPQRHLQGVEVYSEIIRECFGIEIRQLPGRINELTHGICPTCVTRLQDARDFKKQVLNCEERFLTLYNNAMKAVEPEIIIKEEMPDDDVSDAIIGYSRVEVDVNIEHENSVDENVQDDENEDSNDSEIDSDSSLVQLKDLVPKNKRKGKPKKLKKAKPPEVFEDENSALNDFGYDGSAPNDFEDDCSTPKPKKAKTSPNQDKTGPNQKLERTTPNRKCKLTQEEKDIMDENERLAKKNMNLSINNRNQILLLSKQGRNISEIARELNFSRDTVRRWVRRAAEGAILARRRARPPRKLSPEGIKQLIVEYKENPLMTTAYFADKFGCSPRCVRNVLRRAGLRHLRQEAEGM